jgi:putative transport protein
VTLCVVAPAVAYAVAWVLGFDAGYAGGLLSGALTESPGMGRASEAINPLPLEAEGAGLVSHVEVRDAICCVFDAFGGIRFCGNIAPRPLAIDLRNESLRVE